MIEAVAPRPPSPWKPRVRCIGRQVCVGGLSDSPGLGTELAPSERAPFRA